MRNTDPGAIGFVGLGDMGGGIAMNLAKSGLELLAHDLRAGFGDRHAVLAAR